VLGPDCDDGMLEQAAAEQDHFDRRMLDQRDRDRRTVRDDCRVQVVREISRDLQRRGAAIENHDLTALDQLRRGPTDRRLGIGRNLLPAGKVDDSRRGGQSTAMHALQPPGGGELSQIASDGVLRKLQLAAHVLGDDLPLHVQDLEQVILALAGEHARTMHEFS
jgi:hypothetical protein